ncbi:hypothetical protein GCM10022225_49080 [Plantactinospora mayteni]|uniref:Secreted protein n=1 Tax=Plantactinospora mayteni TaxID=566021 RepID=A0ABQ4ESH6_9ACTN|nr:hypothetical protein Pma05_41530 [Plantactinospora mayteni]
MPWLAALFFRAFFFRDFFAMLTSVGLPGAARDRPFLLAPGNPPMVAVRPRRGGVLGTPRPGVHGRHASPHTPARECSAGSLGD